MIAFDWLISDYYLILQKSGRKNQMIIRWGPIGLYSIIGF